MSKDDSKKKVIKIKMKQSHVSPTVDTSSTEQPKETPSHDTVKNKLSQTQSSEQFQEERPKNTPQQEIQGSYQQGDRPQRSYQQGDRPQRSYQQGDRPQRSYQQGDRPQGSYQQGDRPQGSYQQGDRPQRSYQQGDRPQGSYQQGDRPQRSYQQGDRPQRPYQQGDRPQGSYQQGDRPQRSYQQGDRPQGSYQQGDRPQRSYQQGDRPQRSYQQGDRPQRSYQQGDRPQRSYQQGDRPQRPYQQGDRPQRPYQQGDRPQGSYQQGDRPQRSYQQGDRPQRPYQQGDRASAPRTNNFRSNTPTPSTQNNAKTISHRREVLHKDKRVFSGRPHKLSQEDIALSKLQLAGKKKTGEAVVPEQIEIGPIVKLSDLAHKMNLKSAELISTLFKLGQQATINDDLDSDTAILLAEEFNCRVVVKDEQEEVQIKLEEDKIEDLSHRPPIVTIMGHVDHGKTKLLDTIRKTNVIAHESGGITQHIGAYSVKVPQGDVITFLDTPGHAAFTSMRARGAQITDIVILVVSAEEGPKPQTLEALSHARAAKVPIIVAINKIDLPNANPEKIKQMLSEYGLLAEDWGGDTMYLPVSAFTGEGIPELLDAILLQAEVMELKANPNRLGTGFIVESKMDVGRGAIATVIIKNGTVKIGDSYVAGTTFGKIRALFNDHGGKENSAGPSIPIEIMGFDSLPEAGDDFHVLTSEDEARSLANRRAILRRNEDIIRQKKSSMKTAIEKIKNPNLKEYKVVIKADVNGSLEAILYALSKLKNTEVRVTVVHSGIGTVSENDIMLAQTLADSSASETAVLAFRVRVDSIAKARAENVGIAIRRYNVIYDLVEHVHSIIEGMLDPEVSETKIGEAEIKEVIKITNVGKVAGSLITEGFLRKNNTVRIFREGVQIFSGDFKSIRRFKDEVTEVQVGFECGITFINYDDFKVGDIIETYQVETSNRKLELIEGVEEE
ncbi:MAG: translation initiation factor IF-2 [Brevinema sp.]